MYLFTIQDYFALKLANIFYNGQLDNALMDVKQIAEANMKNSRWLVLHTMGEKIILKSHLNPYNIHMTVLVTYIISHLKL
jgi:hypothetical protein